MSQPIRWSLSPSSITLRSEMARGGGAEAFSFGGKGGAGEG